MIFMLNSLRLRFAVTVVSVLIAGCATVAIERSHDAAALSARVHAVLDARGLGAEALGVIHNLVHNEAPPPFAPPLVRELLKDPLATADASRLFSRAVPAALLRLADAAGSGNRLPPPVDIERLLAPYINELAEAQRVLRAAVPAAAVDAGNILESLQSHAPQAAALLAIGRAADEAAIARANAMFLDATTRFIAGLNAAGGHVRFPDAVMRFESAIGTVVIGSRGNEAHAGDAALIIDPGGDDSYTRAPVTGGAVSIVIDLGGDDRYGGSDVVVHGLSAIVDFSGNDRYAMSGPGLGAAVAGAAVVLDLAGDDVYEAGSFAQGAAAFGIGAVIDLAGNDSYRIHANGQGYGMAGGLALLWDRAGNDSYAAAGMRDVFDRGGAISSAQGAAFGYRTSIGGGIGILRDDAGDDSYTAEMFAQGVGFYYGVGVLWDRGGNDRYSAIRYAQGNGVHEAIGVLRDESGDDSYATTVGVSQGMGLDLAVGVLYDGGGNDSYRGDALVQGAATANGLGLLFDAGGVDRWQTGADRRVWGWAEWYRGLPTVGILLQDPAQASFVRAGKIYTPRPDSARLGGPLGGEPAAAEAAAVVQCPKPAAGEPVESMDFSAALLRLAPGFGGGKPDAAAYIAARRHLTTRMQEAIAGVHANDFSAAWALGHVLNCVAHAATNDEIESMWSAIERLLATGTPFTGQLLGVLRQRPPPAARLQRILQPLTADRSCGMRAGLLRLQANAPNDDDSRAQLIRDANAALADSCLRLQLAARDVLRRLRAPYDDQRLPRFLRGIVLE